MKIDNDEIVVGKMKTNNEIVIAKEQDRIYEFIVRLFDIIFSVSVLFVFIPIWLLIAVVIYLDDPHGSPFFCQERIGKNGRTFIMFKFRSMYVDAENRLDSLMKDNESDGPVFKIKDDPRITCFGKLIRRTSIDEFPQMINVLLGDMSIVGPRPPLPREVKEYTPYQFSRLLVKPGLTCYWQVTPNRHQMKFDDWVELDLKYIRERCIRTNLKIIFKTVATMFAAKGE